MCLCIKQKIGKVLQHVFLFILQADRRAQGMRKTPYFLVQCIFILGKKKDWKGINGRGRKWESNEK